MRVEHVDPAGLVVWTCLASESFAEWAGTSLWFDVRPRARRRLACSRSATSASPPSCPCFTTCSPRWESRLANLARERVGATPGL